MAAAARRTRGFAGARGEPAGAAGKGPSGASVSLRASRNEAAAATHVTVRPQLMQRRWGRVGEAASPPAVTRGRRWAGCVHSGGDSPSGCGCSPSPPQQPGPGCGRLPGAAGGAGHGFHSAGNAGLWCPRHFHFTAC